MTEDQSMMEKMKLKYFDMIVMLNKIPNDIIALGLRLSLAGMFWKSMQTKIVNGELFNIQSFFFYETSDGDFSKIPLLSGDALAYVTVGAETIFPILLVLGFATRLSALALMGMTAAIQIFVYPQAWDSHLLWGTAMLFLLARGAGKFSLDHLISKKCDCPT